MTIRIVRKCTKCGVKKPFSKFHKHPRYKNGRMRQCIDCVRRANRERQRSKYAALTPEERSWIAQERKDYQQSYRDVTRTRYRKVRNEWRRKTAPILRFRAMKKLGGKCAECGIDDFRVLEIDHVNGGGTADRRKRNDMTRHLAIINGEQGFQLLCGNCHRIKTYFLRHPEES